jgi:hypothetical protein
MTEWVRGPFAEETPHPLSPLRYLHALSHKGRGHERHAPRLLLRRYTDGMTFSAGNHWPTNVGGQGTAMK